MTRGKAKILIILCSGFILMLLAGSMTFNYLYGGNIPQTLLAYSQDGKVLSKAPFEPSIEHLFGTDRNGYDMFYKVLQGAQYTLGAAVVISMLSFAVSFIAGVVWGFMNSANQFISQTLLSSLYFIPQSIIAYNILFPLLWEPQGGFDTTFTERVMLTIITLAIITVPTTAVLISNETREILKKEFILSARVLGGSRLFLFKKHVMPHLKLRLFIIYPKVVIQVLLIIVHLGFFQLFFGGTDVCYGPFCDPPKPIVQEWAGLMALNFHELFNAWWIFMVPMIFFSFTILSLNGVARGIEVMLESSVGNGAKKEPKEKASQTTSIKRMPRVEDFKRISGQDADGSHIVFSNTTSSKG
ncbi:ABC transporter permease [Lysinibacillus sphaericus]